MAPPHRIVPTLMHNLFNWMNEVKEKVNPLILYSIFHYEFVFIHPLSDENGRTARFNNEIGCVLKYFPNSLSFFIYIWN